MNSTNPGSLNSKVRNWFKPTLAIAYILLAGFAFIYGLLRFADEFVPQANQEKMNCIQSARAKVRGLDLDPALKSYFLHRLDEQGNHDSVELKDVQATVDEAKTCVRAEPQTTKEAARKDMEDAQKRMRDVAAQKAALLSRH